MSTKHSSITGADLHYSKVKNASGNPNSNTFATTANSYVGDIYLDKDTQTVYVRKTLTGSNDWAAAPIQHIGTHPMIFTTTGATSLILPTSGTLISSDSAQGITSGMILDGTIQNVDINAAAGIVYSKLALAGAIKNSDLEGNISVSKLAALTANQVVITDGSGLLSTYPSLNPTKLQYLNTVVSDIQTQLNNKQDIPGGGNSFIYALTGDVTSAATGTPGVNSTTIGNNRVSNSMLQNSSVDSNKLATDSVTNVKILDGAVTDAKISGPISNGKTTASTSASANTIALRDGTGGLTVDAINTKTAVLSGSTLGGSYVELTGQTVAPSTPAAGKSRVYSGDGSGVSASGLHVKTPSGGDSSLDFNLVTGSKEFTFPNATGQVVVDSAAQTLTNKTIGVDGLRLSNTTTPTSPAAGLVKIYTKSDTLYTLNSAGVEKAVGNVSAIAGNTLTLTGAGNYIRLESGTPATGIAGSTTISSGPTSDTLNITTIGGNRAVVFPQVGTFTFPSNSGTLATLAGTELLSSKILSSPSIQGNSATPGTGQINLATNAVANTLSIRGESGSTANLVTSTVSGSKDFTFPDASGTILIDTATQGISNKTVNDALIFDAIASPSTPAAGKIKVYGGSGVLLVKDSSGTVTTVGGGGITSLTGDVTGSGSGAVATTIGASKVLDSMIASTPSVSATGNSLVKRSSGGGIQASDVAASRIDITGTAGAGYINLISQSSGASTPTSGLNMWANSGAFKLSNVSGFVTSLDTSAMTTSRTYTLPDLTGTIVLTSGAQTLTNKTLSAPAISAPTGIVKGDVGLGNVDNTSDATKNAASVILTNKSISGASNTFSAIPNGATTATNANTALMIVSRDSSGGFSAGQGTFTSVIGSTFVNTPISMISNYGEFTAVTAPLSATAGSVRLYAKSDKKLYIKDDIGVETIIGGGGITALTGDVTGSGSGSVSTIIGAGKVTNGMLAGSIDDSKLLQITSTGKVSDSATTATSSNLSDRIVKRDSSGAFLASSIGVKTFSIDGTTNSGDAFLRLASQSTGVLGSGGFITLYGSGSSSAINVVRSDSITAGLSFSSLSANRAYTFPDASGSLVIADATQTLTNKTITSPLGIVKGDVGLGNVDNTSDATKNSSTATLSNKTFSDPLTLTQVSTPSAPAAGKNKLYVKSDNNLYRMDSAGNEIATGNGDVTLSGVQTLSNKSISGAGNTLSNIPNSALSTQTTANIAGNIVTRDGSGGFQAGSVQLQQVIMSGALDNGDSYLSLTSQTGNPSASTGTSKVWSNNSGQSINVTKPGGSVAQLNFSLLSTSRVYTFPDATGTIMHKDGSGDFSANNASLASVSTSGLVDATNLVVRTNMEMWQSNTAVTTPAYGKVRFFSKLSDEKIYTKDSSGVEKAILRAGDAVSGGINYVKNPDFEDGTVTGWAAYADAAGVIPIDGTGGTASVTVTNSTSSPLRGINSLLLTKDAANRQGQGISYDFSIDAADKGKPLSISFDAEVSAGLVAGDVKVFVYDVTNSTLIYPSSQNISTGTFTASFVSTASTSYRLVFHVATTSATAYTIKVDNVNVGPSKILQGAAITDWQTYIPTEVNKGTAVYSGSWYWRRVGSSIEVSANLVTTTVGSAAGIYSFTLPSGLMFKDPGAKATGVWGLRSAPTASPATIALFSSNSFAVGSSGSAYQTNTLFPSATAGSEVIYVSAKAEIDGWSSNVTMADRVLEEYVSHDGTSVVYGIAGSIVPSIATGGSDITRNLTFQNTVQATDKLVVEIQPGGTGPWISSEEVYPYTRQGGLSFGIQVASTSSSGVTVLFGGAGAISTNGTYGSSTGGFAWSSVNLAGTRWRVRKVSSGAAIGGAISTANVVGRTDGIAPGTGYIGEVIESLINSDTVLSTTSGVETDIASVTLTAGCWELEGWANLDFNGGTGSGGTGRIGRIRITDNSNVEQRTTLSGLATAANPVTTAFAYVKIRVTVAGSTTYKLRAGSIERSSATTLGALNAQAATGRPSVLRAVRIA